MIISKQEGIRSLVDIKNNINPRISQLNVNGRIIDKSIQIANEVNDFFVNVGAQILKKKFQKFQISLQNISLKQKLFQLYNSTYI